MDNQKGNDQLLKSIAMVKRANFSNKQMAEMFNFDVAHISRLVKEAIERGLLKKPLDKPNKIECSREVQQRQKIRRKSVPKVPLEMHPEIWRLREEGISNMELARKFNVSSTTIWAYCRDMAKTCKKKQVRILMRKPKVPLEMHPEIRRLREAGISNSELARKFDVDPATIRAYCRGKAKTCKKRLLKKKYNITVDWLANQIGNDSSEEEEEGESSSSRSEQAAIEDDGGNTEGGGIEPDDEKPTKKYSTLFSRFCLRGNCPTYSDFGWQNRKHVYHVHLFKLKPFNAPSHTKGGRPPTVSARKLKKVKALLNNQLDSAHSLYNYTCHDCYFHLVALPFIPIVYLVIDHFLDCKDHLVNEEVQKLFAIEREAFNAFLGVDFNHAYKLPKEARLTFFPWNPLDNFHCALRMPGQRTERQETQQFDWDKENMRKQRNNSDLEEEDEEEGEEDESEVEETDDDDYGGKEEERMLTEEFGDMNLPSTSIGSRR